MKQWPFGLAVAGLCAVVAVSARAQECVRVVGTNLDAGNTTMDPAFLSTDDDAYHQFAIYNRLVDLDDNMEPIPELAESWSVSDDGLTWTFKLREGITFHDGSTFDAGDVVYTIRRVLDPAVGSPGAGSVSFLNADGIVAVDDLTVSITTDDIVAELPTLIAVKNLLIVSEGATAEDLKLHGNGTGPFVQERFSPDENRRIVRRNANYWKDGLPKAECLEIWAMTEEVPRTAALLSGEIDLLLNTPASSIPQLSADPSVELLSTGPGSDYSFIMHRDTPPFDDPKVVAALKAVVDRQALVDTVLLGYGEAANDNPIPVSWPSAYMHEAPPPDIERATQLLAEAGYPDGIDIDFQTGEGLGGMILLSEAFQQQAAQAGIRINLIQHPADQYWSTVWMKYPFHFGSWSARPPAQALTVAAHSSSEWHETAWNNAAYDALMDAAAKELDPDKRGEMYKDAQRMIAEEGGYITPFFIFENAAIRTECSGYTPHVQSNNIGYETLVCER